MTARSLSILVVPLLVLSAAYAGQVREGSLSAHSDGTKISVRWLSEDEASVTRFEVERKAGLSGPFILLAQIALKGNNSAYEYVDESAFRVAESIYQYRIKVVLANGDAVYYGPVTVRHDVSNVRRTWGSIKAMFR